MSPLSGIVCNYRKAWKKAWDPMCQILMIFFLEIMTYISPLTGITFVITEKHERMFGSYVSNT